MPTTPPTEPPTTPEPRPDLRSLWDFGDPAASEQRFRALLPAAEADGDRGWHAELLTQVARAQGLQRRFDDARSTLDSARDLIDEHMHRARTLYELELGRVLNSSGDPAAARPHFLEAWSLCWNLVALELADRSPDPDARRWRASLNNNIGWTLHEQGQYDEALACFEEALRLRREDGTPEDVRVARWCVARCLRSLERYDDALAIQRELEAEIADQPDPDGYVYEELAECLYALRRADEARPHFRRACTLLGNDPWLAEAEPQRIERLCALGGALAPDADQ
jgi:tetratricopeptide (TPR) repeat protein